MQSCVAVTNFSSSSRAVSWLHHSNWSHCVWFHVSRLTSQSFAQPSSRAKTLGLVPTSAQQLPQRHSAVVSPQQPAACEQAAQVVGQVGAGDIQHTSFQAVHKSKQLQSKQAPAERPEPDSRTAQAANGALERPISQGKSNKESDGEQLRVKPMPESLQLRKRQSNPHHERQQPMVRAMVKLNPHEAVTMDLPAHQPSSSAVVQTATLDRGATPQSTHQPLEAPSSPRRSARHQQLAHPAAQGVIPGAVNNAGAQAATAHAPVAVGRAATTATVQLQAQDQPCKLTKNKEKATVGKQDHLNKQFRPMPAAQARMSRESMPYFDATKTGQLCS